jgi:hypothetical protein
MVTRYVFVAATILIAQDAWSHGGGLDKYGCHNNRKTVVSQFE